MKERQTINAIVKRNRTNDKLQNTTHITKDRAT